MKFPISIRLLNVLGGTLFACGSLLFIQSVVVAVGNQVQATVNTASLIVAGNTPGRLTPSDIKERSALSKEMVNLSADMFSQQQLFFAQAVIGTGLVCLREKSRE
ncbi:MAG: hypothetical protein KME27_13305 [Lyngbya sp. HA4199-MV5]|nr:hypothetical protein [Lyngbya sp. HA4199-MV5]